MAKGIAQLGITFLLGLFTNGSYAVSAVDIVVTEIIADSPALIDTRGDWFAFCGPNASEYGLSAGAFEDVSADCLKIESDLLILPLVYLNLACHTNPESLFQGKKNNSRQRGEWDEQA